MAGEARLGFGREFLGLALLARHRPEALNTLDSMPVRSPWG
jgi:hypothetical protein